MNKKMIFSIVFILSLIPMLFSQYGTIKGVQEASGILNLTNPIAIIAIILYFIGVWVNFKNEKINKYLSYAGMVGIILSELKNFLTWNYPNPSYYYGIKNCFKMVFPMFYVGLITSIFLIVIFRYIDRKFIKEEK